MTYRQSKHELNQRGYVQVGLVWFSRTGLRYHFREAMERCGLWRSRSHSFRRATPSYESITSNIG
jgi:hypothetical protein